MEGKKMIFSPRGTARQNGNSGRPEDRKEK